MAAPSVLRRSTLAGAAWALAVAAACVPPPRMCVAESDCGTQASCVAGRCVAHGATPAIATARRLLVSPVQQGWVRRGDGATGGVAVLGRGDDAVVFLRFSVPLPPEMTVLEAYLLLERAPGIDTDPGTLALHAARIEGGWDASSLSWGRQPPVDEVGSPVTTVQVGAAAQGTPVRLDVRGIVERWRRRDPEDDGIAIVSEGRSTSGLPLALVPIDVPPDRDDPILAPLPPSLTQAPSPFEPPPLPSDPVGDPRRQVVGPRLELYVR